jgi:hypothetical protein
VSPTKILCAPRRRTTRAVLPSSPLQSRRACTARR